MQHLWTSSKFNLDFWYAFVPRVWIVRLFSSDVLEEPKKDFAEEVSQRCSIKRLLLEISQKLQESHAVELFLRLICMSYHATVLKLYCRDFLVNFDTFLKTAIPQNTSKQLLLTFVKRGHGSSPPTFGGDLKISDQNNWRGSEQKIKFGGELNFRGGP